MNLLELSPSNRRNFIIRQVPDTWRAKTARREYAVWILCYSAGIKYVYRKCNTKDAFFEYLRQFTFKRYKNYRILYIAFHGRQIGRDFVTLSEIADVLKGHLGGRIVHFGSCSTMRTKRANIDDFMNRTKANILSGYRKNVDFVDSKAWEMVFLLRKSIKIL